MSFLTAMGAPLCLVLLSAVVTLYFRYMYKKYKTRPKNADGVSRHNRDWFDYKNCTKVNKLSL